MYAQPNLMPWVRALREDVPDLAAFDAHVHIGLRDPAGLLAVTARDRMLERHLRWMLSVERAGRRAGGPAAGPGRIGER